MRTEEKKALLKLFYGRRIIEKKYVSTEKKLGIREESEEKMRVHIEQTNVDVIRTEEATLQQPHFHSFDILTATVTQY